ncbi:MAG: hypothetical protein PHR28_05045 [candidate division Zixibacteria bacterium]|nr:hypothetical protein [candidate division Zixibacteria bacterium]
MTRAELLAEAAGRTPRFSRHLASCPDCRELVELFRTFAVAGNLPLPDAPAGWIAGAEAVAEQRKPLEQLKRLVADLILDTWRMPAPVGVRGPGALDQRRLRFRAEEIEFDLRAERRVKGWALIAQTSSPTGHDEKTWLEVDGKVHFAGADGLYQWWSARPPKHILFGIGGRMVVFPELAWKKKRST